VAEEAKKKTKERPRTLLPAHRVVPIVIAIATAILAWRCIRALLVQVGEPCGTLDDSFIHFQYARAIAEGHPLRYQAGEPFTSGATSVLWPALLAPFYLLGFKGVSLMWPAWGFSFAALGLLAYDAYRIAIPLTGRATALAAGAMVLTFSGFAWCASSGMEVIPFAWSMARCVRLASDWSESPARRTKQLRIQLLVMAFVTALFRPEGSVLALWVAATFAVHPEAPGKPLLRSGRPWAAVAAFAVLVTPLLLLVTTGSTKSNTALVKLLPGNPYYPGDVMWGVVKDNARTLFKTILNGEVWSAEFLPTGAAPLAMMGLVAIPLRGVMTKRGWRAAGVVILALLMLAPCFYVTFLWNRLRYLWPFATGWMIGLACLARAVGELGTWVNHRMRVIAPLVAAAFAGALAVRLDWTIDDVANSARGIHEQHVKIGRWAAEHLPPDARIGVNDTGAIAYFSNRKTFDIVGLTSKDEGRYWVAGAASRIEHYERLHATDPTRLPTHFIVYPEWMGTTAVLGTFLFDATVTDSTILGGQSMRAFEADYGYLDSGATPWSATSGALVDEVDVADLDSEDAHAYELLGARDGEEVMKDDASTLPLGESKRTLDGGRSRRTRERFVVKADGPLTAIARLEATGPIDLEVRVDGTTAGTLHLEGFGWEEREFTLAAVKKSSRVELVAPTGSVFSAFHYWFYSGASTKR
jgi:hypothetical protein